MPWRPASDLVADPADRALGDELDDGLASGAAEESSSAALLPPSAYALSGPRYRDLRMSILLTYTPATSGECELILAGEWPALAGEEFEGVGKDWAILHRLLLAVEGPQGFAANAIGGGVLVDGDGDIGSVYLPAPKTVAQIAASLDEISDEQLRHGYQTVDLRDVYHHAPSDPSQADSIVRVGADLRSFFHQCALAGHSVLRSPV